MIPNEILVPLLVSTPGALITVFGVIFVAIKTRATGKEANENSEFSAIVLGYKETRALDASRITSLEKDVSELKAKDRQRDTQMRRIKILIQDWLNVLYKAWPHDDVPMPLPSQEAQELLELTVPR